MRMPEPRQAISIDSGRAAQEALQGWVSLRPRLAAYLGSFGGLDEAGREEALQDCLIAFWKHRDRLGPDPRAWLYRVARNAALDLLKLLKREGARRAAAGEDGLDPVETLSCPRPRPEDGLLREEERALVAGFLASVEDSDREILHLAFAEELPYSAIARILGRPLGTVKWRVAELKRRLASRYEKEFG
jgi:RNA polymerase sigma-70 factor (ECF subfamily)